MQMNYIKPTIIKHYVEPTIIVGICGQSGLVTSFIGMLLDRFNLRHNKVDSKTYYHIVTHANGY